MRDCVTHHVCDCIGAERDRLRARVDELEAARDDCAEKNCGNEATLGLTLNLNGVQVEVYLCELHFDAAGDGAAPDQED